ncbi:MAG: zinc-binding dehydrogenase [Verrucomicrobiales bacterium]|nr:zinc-binding dehydrogenase [Verrucomicrobiales bacterium]
MRAAILYGKEDVRIENIRAAELKPGELRVQIEAALTCGTDLKVFKRGYHAKMIVPPAVFGHEWAGRICEIHPDTRGWNLGERVVAANSAPCGACLHCREGQENLCDDLQFLNGAYAESIVIPRRLVEKNLLRLQPTTSFCNAALMEPLACVVQGVDELKLKRGQRVLIIGAGPIGLMFVALAHHLDCQVTAAGRGETRLRTASELGAAAVVDVTGSDEIIPAIRAANVGEFDVVVEAVGKPQLWEAAVRLVRKGGVVNFFGGCPSGTNVSLDTGLLHYSNLTLLASFHHTPRTIRRALEFIEAGVIRADDFVSGEHPLSELPDLLRTMASGNRAVKTMIDLHR